jgi:hypothetical protein
MIMIIANEKPHWFFYFGWVALNVIAVIMAWYIASAITSQVTKIVGDMIQVGGESHITEDFLFIYVLLPITGLVTGVFQYILLRRYLPHMGWWIAATLVGWLTLLLIRLLIRLLAPSNSTFSIMLGLLLIGATMALPQLWMLRQRVGHAFWWPLAYGMGWGIVGLLNVVTSEATPLLLAIALMPAITTGIACWLLLDRFPNRELKSSISSF